MEFESKKEMDARKPSFALLPEDTYKLVITKVEETQKAGYRTKDLEDMVAFTFEIVSLADGGLSIDEDGKTTENRKLFFDGRKNKDSGEWSMGFLKAGGPSRLRALVAHTLGQNVLQKIKFESWQELLDKDVNAVIIQYTKESGEIGNKIDRFMPTRVKAKKEANDLEKENIPVIEDAEEEIDVKDIPY